jgi:hypothetical protein
MEGGTGARIELFRGVFAQRERPMGINLCCVVHG